MIKNRIFPIAMICAVLAGATLISCKSNSDSAQNPQGTAAQDESGSVVMSKLPAYDVRSRTSQPPVNDKAAYIAYMKANTTEEERFLSARWDRMANDKRLYPQTPERVFQAFLLTPREYFVRQQNMARAYDHAWLAIEDGQTISGPHMVLRETATIDPNPTHKVLEIGTGSGYQAAVLSQMTNNVYSIEIKKNLFNATNAIYEQYEEKYPCFRNVRRKHGDGYYGWEEYAPFDRIIVTCGIDHIPPALLKQLTPDGIMVIPVGPMAGQQVLLKITKKVDANGNVLLEREDVYKGKLRVKFVPFTAADGSWHSKENN